MKLNIRKEIGKLKHIAKRLKTKQDFDFNTEEYHNFVSFHDNGLLAKSEKIKDFVQKYKQATADISPLVILDVGCGTGEFDQAIHHEFNRLIGVDSSAGAIKKAKSRNLKNSSFLVASAERLCFTRGLFDFVMLVNCLHHSRGATSAIIQESLRVLKKNGFLLIFELNPFNPLQLIWFNFFSPVDRGMKMVNPLRLKRIITEAAGNRCSINIKPLISSFCFEYMLVYSKAE